MPTSRCHYVLEMPAVGLAHYSHIVKTIHVCGEELGHHLSDNPEARKHRCRKACDFWWVELDHNPFAGGDDDSSTGG